MSPSFAFRVAYKYLRAREKRAFTLYHGTIIDNKRSIEEVGLVPDVGSFVKEMYGEGYDLEDLVFLADKRGLQNALTAMVKQISYKLGKDMHDVTDEEIQKHGLLAKLVDIEPGDYKHRSLKDPEYEEYPSSVEPDDYYSRKPVRVDFILTGPALLRVLRRHGLFPRRQWGPEPSRRDLMGRLMSLAVQKWQRKHQKRIDRESLQGLLDNVKKMTNRDLLEWINYLEVDLKKIRGHRPGQIREPFALSFFGVKDR